MRTFQLELMFASGLAISQKVTIHMKTDPSDPNEYEDHKFLFLQVPFKLLLSTDVFMVIKVYKNTVCKSGNKNE